LSAEIELKDARLRYFMEARRWRILRQYVGLGWHAPWLFKPLLPVAIICALANAKDLAKYVRCLSRQVRVAKLESQLLLALPQQAARLNYNEDERPGRPCPHRRAGRALSAAGGVGEPVAHRIPRTRPGPDTSGPGGHVEIESPPLSKT